METRHMSMVKCPYGDHQIDENSKVCPVCGRLLASNWSKTKAIAQNDDEDTLARFGTSYFSSKMMLHLRLRGEDKTFSIAAEQMVSIIIGRGDPATGEKPAVDLSLHGGMEMGVSRKHAEIVRREDNALHLLDLESANGTHLNGQRLVPRQGRILRNGDEIRLGRLVLLVEFTRPSNS
ncbi:MAG: FHA domain-containing protein [bacterium]|nr:FHA domain-containing protein [bacterium]